MLTNPTTRTLYLCLVMCALGASDTSAQRRGPQGDTYASIATLPDWSGIWVWPFSAFAAENEAMRDMRAPGAPRLTPAALALREARVKEVLSGSAGSAAQPRAGTCTAARPAGMPTVMRFSFGVEFLFTPRRVTILLEQGSTIRRIYTDGRAHSVDADPTLAGESIGYWEGDTLVVDTTAITPGNTLLQGVLTTGRTHVVERMRKLDATHLQIDTSIEDPDMLLEPFRRSRVFERSTLGWFDRACSSDRDGNDQEPDLTPPK